MPIGFGAVVRVVNRVVDENGDKVPQEFMVDGQAVWVKDDLYVPVGLAKIMLHHSMYKMDPVTRQYSYRLGCPDLGLPIEPVPVSDVKRIELIDRDLIPGKTEYRRIHNPITRHAATVAPHPGTADGAYPGSYGDVK